jgi:NADH:ubiquinone oxidoreductase subunit E
MKIQVCNWNKCRANFSEYILKRLENDKNFFKMDKLILENCLCSWNCKDWPIVFFDWNMEKKVTPSCASKILIDKRK